MEMGERLNDKGVLLPISDTDTFVILKNRIKLKKYYKFTTAELDVVNKMLNKNNFYKLVENPPVKESPQTVFHPTIFTTNNIPVQSRLCVVNPFP